MPHADALPETVAADRLAALVADAAADARPPARLVGHLRALDEAGTAEAAALGAALFESIHYRLPAFADDELPLLASRLYARDSRVDTAFLLAALAVQLRPRFEPALAALRALQSAHIAAGGPPSAEIAAKADAIVRAHEPGQTLLLALEALDAKGQHAAAAALFEAVWPRVRPLAEFWIYYRMAKVYAELGREHACALLASIAIQFEPFDRVSDAAYLLLLGFFRRQGRLRDAAELCVRRHGFCAEPRLLGDAELASLLAQAGPLLLSPPPEGRRDLEVMPGDIRQPRPWRCYGAGVPNALQQLLGEMARDPISVAELRDADVLLDRGAVAVFGADAAPHVDLSLRCFPPLLRRALLDAEDGGGLSDEIDADAAVLISDEFPGANLCHFLLDHATRLELYRRAGVRIEDVTVLGPELSHEYQRVTAELMGVRRYVPVSRQLRVRVGRLWVSSTCHKLRHPAHWAAPWAVQAVRERFDLAPRRPARRLLVSRSDSQWRRIRNEAQIFNLLETLGFELIVPGALSFAEQIAAFRDATHIVAPHGAGLANILWCAPGTHVLEVFHPHYGTWAYAMLNDVLDLDYATLVGRDADSDAPGFNDPTLPRERMAPHAGRDIVVDPDELERWLIDSEAL